MPETMQEACHSTRKLENLLVKIMLINFPCINNLRNYLYLVIDSDFWVEGYNTNEGAKILNHITKNSELNSCEEIYIQKNKLPDSHLLTSFE